MIWHFVWQPAILYLTSPRSLLLGPRVREGPGLFFMRTYAFIDGFNLYHSLIGSKRGIVGPLAKYRWLNLRRVVTDYLDTGDTLDSIFFFTAYTTWDGKKIGRHKTYVRALASEGIVTVLGKFYEVEKQCRQCGHEYFTFEEKQSDVNLSTYILHHAHIGGYEKAMIVTGDSDICPPIRTVREAFPEKRITVLIPPGRKAEDLKEVAHSHHSITEDCLKRNQFPGFLSDSKGVFNIPTGWAG